MSNPRNWRFTPRSLRWRLQLWQGMLLAAMMVAFGVTTYRFQTANRWREVDAELQTRLTALTKATRAPSRHGPGGPPPFQHRGEFGFGQPGRPPRDSGPFGRGPGRGPGYPPPPRWNEAAEKFALPEETQAMFGAASGYYFVVWLRGGQSLSKSGNAPVDVPRPEVEGADALAHFRTRQSATGQAWREALHCTEFGECSVVGRSVQSDLAATRALVWTLGGAGAAVLAFGFGLGAFLIGRAIRPVEDMSSTAARFAAGNLSERIPIADADDELGRLAAQLNQTFAGLEAAFERQRQFTADAAHELRTPLAILISEAQTTLARGRSALEYRETVEGGLETAQQMRRILEMLLDLARFDSEREDSAPREPLDLGDLARRALETLQPLAYERAIALEASLKPAWICAAAARVEVVLANLLGNAIEYNHGGGQVRLETYSDDVFSVLRIGDTGPGIAREDQPHIFDRFWRADKSRSRARGHAGLGLAICKTIVEAEHGTIEVASRIGRGTTFTVRLPLAAPPVPENTDTLASTTP